MMRRVERRPRLLVRVRFDAVRPGPLPLREPGMVRDALPRRLHRRVRRARRGAGSTRCTCWPPPCSTGRRSDTASRTASSSATTAARCRSARQLPGPRHGVRHAGAPTPCAGSSCRRRCCGARTSSSTPRASRRSRPRTVLKPLWNTWYFLSLYANADGLRAHGPAPTPTAVLDRYILAKTAAARRRRHRGDGRLRPLRRVRGDRRVPRRAHQLVRPAQPTPVLGAATPRPSTRPGAYVHRGACAGVRRAPCCPSSPRTSGSA